MKILNSQKGDSIIRLQRAIRQWVFTQKIEKSKDLLLALYKGWKVRKLLQENDVLTALMNIQDINAYIEELEYSQETENLEPTKAQRKNLVTEFIMLLDEYLDPKVEEEVVQSRRASIYNWAKNIENQVLPTILNVFIEFPQK